MRLTKRSWSINLAVAASQRSEEFNKVGAVVCQADGVVIGLGYNGPPPGVDLEATSRDERRPYVIHAEANALRLTTPQIASGGWLSTSMHPCAECVKLAAAYGIREINWKHELDWSIYDRAAIQLVAFRTNVRLIQDQGDHHA
jgi:deoxycytidylate deaminase